MLITAVFPLKQHLFSQWGLPPTNKIGATPNSVEDNQLDIHDKVHQIHENLI